MKPYPTQGEYPAVPGNKIWSPADVLGPTSYAVIVPASPLVTGGQLIAASKFGMKYLEMVFHGTSDDGSYIVVAYLVPFQTGQPSTSVRLQWITAATGAEVVATTNLSARTVRVWAIGS